MNAFVKSPEIEQKGMREMTYNRNQPGFDVNPGWWFFPSGA